MEDPKHFTVTVRLRGYDQTPASMAELVGRSLRTHPTLGCRTDEVTAVEVPIVPPVRAGDYADGFMEPVTEHDRAVDAAFDADMAALTNATPIVAYPADGPPSVDLFGRRVGDPKFGTVPDPDDFPVDMETLTALSMPRVPVTAEPAPLGDWHDDRGWEPATPADELRTLHLAIRRATQAFARGDTLALATVNPAIQPLVDAALLFARTVGR